MDTKGGRVSMTGNGQTFVGRGTFKVTASRVEIENFANADGSGSSTVKPMLTDLEGDFDRGRGIAWDETMMLRSWDWTFVEDDVGVIHMFTGARFSGRPTIDTANGQVTGLKIQSDRYQQI